MAGGLQPWEGWQQLPARAQAEAQRWGCPGQGLLTDQASETHCTECLNPHPPHGKAALSSAPQDQEALCVANFPTAQATLGHVVSALGVEKQPRIWDFNA